VMCTYYAPLRFGMDFLREAAGVTVGGYSAGGDARYFGLTPAQWGCLPLFTLGIVLLLRAPERGTDPPIAPPDLVPLPPKP
jgi:phosphatidylglycerol---prolipoprotein diacylglyceryl transferase